MATQITQLYLTHRFIFQKSLIYFNFRYLHKETSMLVNDDFYACKTHVVQSHEAHSFVIKWRNRPVIVRMIEIADGLELVLVHNYLLAIIRLVVVAMRCDAMRCCYLISARRQLFLCFPASPVRFIICIM